MGRKVLCACLALRLLAPDPLPAQTPSDADVAKGIKQVEDGDLDIAIITLDAAARRLAADPARTRELAQAHLYLGIAYLGKGHETLAKARFKDALTHDRGLSLSPEKFAPRVLELFEKAKEELGRSGPAEAAAPPQAEKKKGGSKTGLVLVGVGGAAAAGIGLAAKAGSDKKGPTTETFSPTLAVGGATDSQPYTFTFTSAGVLDATVTWPDTNAVVELYLFDGPLTGGNSFLTSSNSISETRAQLTSNVTAKLYVLNVYYNRCRVAPCRPVTCNLMVTHP